MGFFKNVNVAQLRANDFVGAKKDFFIVKGKESKQCCIAETKTSKQGKEYTSYTLFVREDDSTPIKEINYLFSHDLLSVIEAYGYDPNEWENCRIDVSAEVVGQYTNWNIKPHGEK